MQQMVHLLLPRCGIEHFQVFSYSACTSWSFYGFNNIRFVFSILGITGNVSIDENGDRYSDFSLFDMDPLSGNFEVVANYYGINKEVVIIPGKIIHWAGGRDSPPPDVPKCGFDESLCPKAGLEKID